MNEMTCPHLGIVGPESEQIAARDYPSLENCCFVESDRTGGEPSHGALLLADQSTYCLSGGYHQCPRFQSISLQTGAYSDSVFPQTLHGDYELSETFSVPTTSLPLDSDYLSSPVDQPDTSFEDAMIASGFDDDEEPTRRLSPAWLLAGTTFISVFLLGIGLALYLGWQLISNSAFADVGSTAVIDSSVISGGADGSAPGDITLVNIGSDEQALYVVQTATPNADSADLASESIPAVQPQEGVSPPDEGAPPPNGQLAVVSDAVEPPPGGRQDNQSDGRGAQAPIQQNFPVAVTPTAIVVAIAGNDGQSNQAPILGANQIVQPENVSAPNSNQLSDTQQGNSQEQLPAFIPAAPTRRPTPSEIPVIPIEAVVPDTQAADLIEIITDAENAQEPTSTPEPTATWQPPIVFFSSIDKQLREGKCTKITWDVQNVRAVYVASLGVDGKGEKEVCIKDKSKVFDLAVVLPDGSTKLYTTTVEIELPTPTPTATWTYTPVPIPTATWTPIPPTALPPPTPTPVLARGARLETAQPQDAAPIGCSAGTSCEIGLWAINTGEGVDNLVIVLADRSQPSWPVLLCRSGDICSADRLIQTSVQQGERAFITLRLTVPPEAVGQSGSYSLYAASQESGETVRSETLVLNVSVP